MKKTASALGVAILGLGSSFISSPAIAATIADCGTAPAGGTLTITGDVCQLTFSAPGTYTFTTPSSSEGLAGLLVGGGGGAESSGGQFQNFGYAGSGGKVIYVDLTAAESGEELSITVGGGGKSLDASPASDGQPSTFSIGSTVSAAAGGLRASTQAYCAFPGNTSDYLGVGDGAGGNTTSRLGEICVEAPGVNPSVGTNDSNGAAPSTNFAGLNQEFGAGGKLIGLPSSLPSKTVGAGANVAVDAAETGADPVADAAGANGFAAIAWQLPAAPEAVALADTGSDLNGPLLLGVGSLVLGFLVLTGATRRRRV